MKHPVTRRAKIVFSAIFLMSLLLATVVSADGHAADRTYQVTVVNLTKGQPFTPPILATHSQDIRMWQRGQAANIGIQEIAENGNLGPMLDILNGSDAVSDVVVAVAGDPPPLMPFSLVSESVTADSSHDVLSMASMLICTNDGFTGVDSVRLPRRVGSGKVYILRGYDAGTEINTEDFDDIVPPCGPLTNVDSAGAGTGMSNPDLAENGVITRHRGVDGIADLVPAIHDWRGPVGIIYVERTQ